jgi:hypothetical protein
MTENVAFASNVLFGTPGERLSTMMFLNSPQAWLTA